MLPALCGDNGRASAAAPALRPALRPRVLPSPGAHGAAASQPSSDTRHLTVATKPAEVQTQGRGFSAPGLVRLLS